MVKPGRPPQDPARQRERAHRILDAATELVLRWGYDKTTIDDVAKRAGVAKGTIYLHWKTRDELFTALLRRERVLMLDGVRRSEPATLSALYGSFAREVLRRPLLHALLGDDSEVLGKLTRQKLRGTGTPELFPALDSYLAELIKRGAVREEPGDHATVVGSILYGFLCMPEGMHGATRPSDDQLADLVADTIERTMSTGRPLSDDDAHAVARATRECLDAVTEIAETKLAASMNGYSSTAGSAR
ncbi:TetR/AcrR family transcriptional regulator [Nonomuraea diastatica]|uniref:TetR/AcrR family transcriptional regulator n=1 Tax=Nonomuraea diastatica TaxID=1848329 RepID=A0A4V2YF15_9ACTN|nr:TetR/AcrR family transcriptional regulator [Nonomuraea diastatica]TDD21417.1 TetR/AcrR family transcriptional regulator [Nonomuraea diastatica]